VRSFFLFRQHNMPECSVLVVIFKKGEHIQAKELGVFSSDASAQELLKLTLLQHEHQDWTWMEDESAWRFADLMLRVQRIYVNEPIVVDQECYVAIRLFSNEEAQLNVLGQDIQLKRWHAEVLCVSPLAVVVVGATMLFIQLSELVWEAKENYNWDCDGQHIQILRRKVAQ